MMIANNTNGKQKGSQDVKGWKAPLEIFEFKSLARAGLHNPVEVSNE